MAQGIVRKAMVYLGLTDDDYEDYDTYEDTSQVSAAQPAHQPIPRRSPMDVQDPGPSPVSAVRPLPREPGGMGVMDPSGSFSVQRQAVVRPFNPMQSAKVHVVAPASFGDAQQIGDRFKNGQPVIVNLQTGNRELSRRMIDFCSGVTYALSGSMDRVADQVFLLTPSNVEVSAEEKRRLQEKGLYSS